MVGVSFSFAARNGCVHLELVDALDQPGIGALVSELMSIAWRGGRRNDRFHHSLRFSYDSLSLLEIARVTT